MKNPFVKTDNSNTWMVAIAAGAITAGVIAYSYFTRDKQTADDAAAEHATDYLQVKVPKKRKQKTDIHELENIAAHQ